MHFTSEALAQCGSSRKASFQSSKDTGMALWSLQEGFLKHVEAACVCVLREQVGGGRGVGPEDRTYVGS